MHTHCVLQDSIPELSEVFIVRLTAIELVDNISLANTMPPLLGSATVAQVEVNPNDNPEGVFGFQFAMYVSVLHLVMCTQVNCTIIGLMLVKTWVSSTLQYSEMEEHLE